MILLLCYEVGDAEAVARAVALLRDDDRSVRARAARAVGQLARRGDARAVDALATWAACEDPHYYY